MDSIFDDLLRQVTSPEGANALGARLGTDAGAARGAAEAALPAIFAALARNAGKPGGAESLFGALQRDHDGSVLDDLAGAIGGQRPTADGGSILGHVFGDSQRDVQTQLGQSTGLDIGSMGTLLTTLAPLVLGALGKAQRSGSVNAGGLAQQLGLERERAVNSLGERSTGLGSLLDMDGDGRIDAHVKSLGAKLLGSLFGRR